MTKMHFILIVLYFFSRELSFHKKGQKFIIKVGNKIPLV